METLSVEELFNSFNGQKNEKSNEKVIPMDKQENINLEEEVRKWKDARNKIKKLEREIKLLEKDKNEAAEKIKKSGFVVPNEPFLFMDNEIKWTKYKQRILDSKRLKKDLPDIYEKYSEEKERERFTIS